MTRDEIIRAIQQSPLSDDDIQKILQAIMEKAMGEALMAAAMDLMQWNKKSEGEAGDGGGA